MIKKLSLLLLMTIAIASANADEGMWTLYNLPPQVYDVMQQEGFKVPYDNLYKSDNSISKCVVNFGGFCSGVVVSADGLVFTNHHCGFEAIRSHSTVEHDYMKDGFYAKSYADELPNKDLFVSFMVSQEDITPRLHKLGIDKETLTDKRESIIDSLLKVVNDSISKVDSTLHADIDPFYEGNKYFMTVYRDFNDVRLVFAPTKSLGKFGGETDNWMWPRQTCDFSVFRIYANPKTNGPAFYSKDNVPYHPTKHAQVSLQGYKDGDYAMTIGYPGSTDRYLSSFGIREMRDAINTSRVQAREIKQAIMKKYMDKDQAIRIKYDSKFAQSSNYWKNSIGMNHCIDSLGIIPQKQQFEAQIRHWADSTGYLKDSLKFNLMARLYAERFDKARMINYFNESFRRGSDFASRAIRYNTHVKLNDKNQIEIENDNEYDEKVDKEMFVAMLENYAKQVKPEYLPDVYKTINKKFGGNYQKYADYMYKHSILMKFGKKINSKSRKYKKDCGVQFGLSMVDFLAQQRNEYSTISDTIDIQEQYLCDAILRMEQNMPHYSDANFTMRLSYGTVGGYTIHGNKTSYYTTPSSIVAKMNQGSTTPDYFAQPEIKSLIEKGDFGPYRDKTTGEMNLCFLTNNDITGGNSGSPMFDGNGNLIGLAFDGNWDSLSSDIYFDSRLARCIGVDIRYVLYIMDKWGHADRLIREIDAK